jgi:copper(I)-binding protein
MQKLPLLLSLIFSVCWAMPSMAGHHKKAAIAVEMPYVRAPVPGHSMTAAFFKLSNDGGQDCTLTTASSSYAKKIEFHTHIHEDGMMKMRPVDIVALPAGSSVEFKPRGLHLMLFGIQQSDSSSAEIRLTTDKCGGVTFLAPIKSVKSKPAKAMHH